MKRSLCILILCARTVLSQNSFNIAVHDQVMSAQNLVSVGPNLYFITKSWGPVEKVTLNSVTSAGIQRFSATVPIQYDYEAITDMIAAGNEGVLISGYSGFCSGATGPYFIMKFDTSGNLIFNQVYAAFTGALNRLMVDADNTILAAGKDTMYRFSANGALISRKHIPVIGNKAVCIAGSFKYLLNGNYQNSTQHVLLDSSGTVLASVPGSTSVNYFRTSSGSFISQNQSGQIEKFTASLQVKVAPNNNEQIGASILFNDTLYSLRGNSINGENTYVRKDTSLSTIGTYTLHAPHRYPNSIALSGNKIAFITYCENLIDAFPMNCIHYGLTFFPKQQGYTYNRDAGVISMDCNSCYATSSYDSLSNYTRLDLHINVNLLVKNFGQDTLKSFNLNSAQSSSDYCSFNFYQKNFGGQQIPPGGTVQLGPVSYTLAHFYSVYGPTSPTIFTMKNLGFYTSIPDHQVDANPSNDLDTITINMPVLTTGIDEIESRGLEVNIKPNPTSDKIALQSEFLLDWIELVDVTGNQLQLVKPTSTKIEVNLSQYPSGIYLMRFVRKGETATKKVVKN